MNRFRGDGVCYELGNKLAVYQNTPTAMNVLVATGGVQIQGYGMYNDAVVTLTIAAASSTLARIDRIIARLTPTGSPGSIVLAVLTGTAAASPTAPALTRTAGGVWEIELAQVSIPANTTSITTALITAAASQPLCAWSIPFMAGITISQGLATTLPGSLTLPAAQIHGVANPGADTDAETKGHVASLFAAFVPTGCRGLITRLTTGSGNFTTDPSTKSVDISIYGPGGGGAGYYATGGGTGYGGGGGSGAWLKKYGISVSPNHQYAYVVGTPGSGGSTTQNGTAGTSSSITINGVTYTAPGGYGGYCPTSAGGTGTPGNGGEVPTSGDDVMPGNPGIGAAGGKPAYPSPFGAGGGDRTSGSVGAIIIFEYS